ncbi:glycoside hydrolase family 3 C-terminal domain-containing protein [Streptomyces sp. DH41]|uniref:glycoside hydrolase family 3 C-terminal domain-containing protein n=1 Tax=Streptomyces sp. DH41 TaxID=3040125 RepID=UPI002441EFA9|nr:glycoside hydrolase family 3 C-terminal domain-containing protein [Streptomyces sp. DH41]MDG9724367.1 glycoside hydrolase family 3 C-terminal domain-containing protein [Streptomyces sp. DH41]
MSPLAPQSPAVPLEDKAALGSGQSFWMTKGVAGCPSMLLTDGPHGVRRQVDSADALGIAPSEPATCFPPAVALAQSWDRDLVERVGAALGAEARALGVDVLLGPGINIKRDPRCGRNFEYYSEDPLLSGELGAAWVKGLQSRGVGASLKHFAVNNQEHERMRVSADVDERTLREIYLRAFERVVKRARPWTVMASYNRINGIPATENRWLLTEVLRGEWGFDGVVVSDWGAVGDRVKALAAGLDLQMPGGDSENEEAVVAAVKAQDLAEDTLDGSVARLMLLADRVKQGREQTPALDLDAHHRLAREAAGRSVVLLKNDGLLPLPATGSIAVIGRFAQEPRYQGGGSSRVNAARVDIPLDEIRALAQDATVTFAEGFSPAKDADAAALRAEAKETARSADVAVVFLGLATEQESEGADRPDIELPAEQTALLAEIAVVQPRTVVVLCHGGLLRLRPAADLVPALLDAGLLGQAGGGAVADVLFGAVNPSGRLAETIPLRLQDAPSYLHFPGEGLHVPYGEGLFVGYRGYDARDLEVEFPFGHGLSYTAFHYQDLTVTADDAGLTAAVTVTNTGSTDGREIVQLYVTGPTGVTRPPRELKGFEAVDLQAGQSARVTVFVPRHDLAYWDVRAHRWVVQGGVYEVSAAASSRDIRLSSPVTVAGDTVRLTLTADSTVGELMAHPVAGQIIAPLMQGHETSASTAEDVLGIDTAQAVAAMPVGRMRSLTGGHGFSTEQLRQLLFAANTAPDDGPDHEPTAQS